jgi:hypothetical protein
LWDASSILLFPAGILLDPARILSGPLSILSDLARTLLGGGARLLTLLSFEVLVRNLRIAKILEVVKSRLRKGNK